MVEKGSLAARRLLSRSQARKVIVAEFRQKRRRRPWLSTLPLSESCPISAKPPRQRVDVRNGLLPRAAFTGGARLSRARTGRLLALSECRVYTANLCPLSGEAEFANLGEDFG
jgi:hypothetical protein